MKVHIELEVSDDVTANEIHEWLCLTIHEGDATALEALQQNVHNITDMDDK
ncbi:hypothetical protein LCGC14_2603500 [marine sediment metagenome]|uniref:Uncharacterized protein n=1 Tax=marine sediment metagenome TaxID=412755 RepID=A0A0F9CJ27_9ZZZZ